MDQPTLMLALFMVLGAVLVTGLVAVPITRNNESSN